MYVSPNFTTKKALKQAVAAGDMVTIFQPNDIFGHGVPENAITTVEGPHAPLPHKWYAEVVVKGGRVTKVR